MCAVSVQNNLKVVNKKFIVRPLFYFFIFVLARWEFNKHIKIHSENKPFNCTICGKGFLYSSHLTKHSQTHINQMCTKDDGDPTRKPYSCQICHKDFVEAKSLKRHMHLQHSTVKYNAEKKHLCTVCGKR